MALYTVGRRKTWPLTKRHNKTNPHCLFVRYVSNDMAKMSILGLFFVYGWARSHSMRVDVTYLTYSFVVAQIAPVSFQTAIPHRPTQGRCTLRWSMSRHQHVCSNYTQEDIREQFNKIWNETCFQLYINICPTNPIQVLNQHEMFEDFVRVLQMIFLT